MNFLTNIFGFKERADEDSSSDEISRQPENITEERPAAPTRVESPREELVEAPRIAAESSLRIATPIIEGVQSEVDFHSSSQNDVTVEETSDRQPTTPGKSPKITEDNQQLHHSYYLRSLSPHSYDKSSSFFIDTPMTTRSQSRFGKRRRKSTNSDFVVVNPKKVRRRRKTPTKQKKVRSSSDGKTNPITSESDYHEHELNDEYSFVTEPESAHDSDHELDNESDLDTIPENPSDKEDHHPSTNESTNILDEKSQFNLDISQLSEQAKAILSSDDMDMDENVMQIVDSEDIVQDVHEEESPSNVIEDNIAEEGGSILQTEEENVDGTDGGVVSAAEENTGGVDDIAEEGDNILMFTTVVEENMDDIISPAVEENFVNIENVTQVLDNENIVQDVREVKSPSNVVENEGVTDEGVTDEGVMDEGGSILNSLEENVNGNDSPVVEENNAEKEIEESSSMNFTTQVMTDDQIIAPLESNDVPLVHTNESVTIDDVTDKVPSPSEDVVPSSIEKDTEVECIEEIKVDEIIVPEMIMDVCADSSSGNSAILDTSEYGSAAAEDFMSVDETNASSESAEVYKIVESSNESESTDENDDEVYEDVSEDSAEKSDGVYEDVSEDSAEKSDGVYEDVSEDSSESSHSTDVSEDSSESSHSTDEKSNGVYEDISEDSAESSHSTDEKSDGVYDDVYVSSALAAFKKLGKKFHKLGAKLVVSLANNDSTSEIPVLSQKEYEILESFLGKLKPPAALKNAAADSETVTTESNVQDSTVVVGNEENTQIAEVDLVAPVVNVATEVAQAPIIDIVEPLVVEVDNGTLVVVEQKQGTVDGSTQTLIDEGTQTVMDIDEGEEKHKKVAESVSMKKVNISVDASVSCGSDEMETQLNFEKSVDTSFEKAEHNDVDENVHRIKRIKFQDVPKFIASSPEVLDEVQYDSNWYARDNLLPTPYKASVVAFDFATPRHIVVPDSAEKQLFHRLPTPYNRLNIGSTPSAAESSSFTFNDSELKKRSFNDYYQDQDNYGIENSARKRIFFGFDQPSSQVPQVSFNVGSNSVSSSKIPKVSFPTSAITFPSPMTTNILPTKVSYVPQFKSNIVQFNSSTAVVNSMKPLIDSTTKAAELSSRSYIERRKLHRLPTPKATTSTAVAKQILNALNTITAPADDSQRHSIPRILPSETVSKTHTSAHMVNNDQKQIDTNELDNKKVRFEEKSTKASNIPTLPKASLQPQKDNSTIQQSVPPSKISFNLPKEDMDSKIKLPQKKPKAPPATGEFTFGEPLQVTGIASHDSLVPDNSIKFVFSPPNKPKKSVVPMNVAASKVVENKPKTVSSKTEDAPATNIWSLSSMNDGKKCPVCMVKNKKDATKCVSCESNLDGGKVSTASNANENKPTNIPSIWSASSINDGIKCIVCMVKNKKDATKCVSCESPLSSQSAAKTGSAAVTSSSTTKVEFGSGSTTSTSGVVSSSGFVFGGNTSNFGSTSQDTDNKSTSFTFGSATTANTSDATNKNAPIGFTFGAPAPPKSVSESFGFTFGSAAATSSTTQSKPKEAVGFTFGAPTEKEQKPMVTFGVNASSDETKLKSDHKAFTFGMNSDSTAATTTAPSVAFSALDNKSKRDADRDDDENASKRSKRKNLDEEDSEWIDAKTSNKTNMFGAQLPFAGGALKSTDTTTGPSSFVFGSTMASTVGTKDKDTKEKAAAISFIGFSAGPSGDRKEEVKPSLPSDQPKTVPPVQPESKPFTFGSSSTNDFNHAASLPTKSFTFGQTSASFGSGSESKPLDAKHTEGTVDTKSTFTFGGTTASSATTTAFGSNSALNTVSGNTNAFGAGTTNTPSAFVFGSAAVAAPPTIAASAVPTPSFSTDTSKLFTFGGNNNVAPTLPSKPDVVPTNQPFSLSNTAATQAPAQAPGPFSTTTSNTAAASTFMFGNSDLTKKNTLSAAAATPATGSSFTFGATNHNNNTGTYGGTTEMLQGPSSNTNNPFSSFGASAPSTTTAAATSAFPTSSNGLFGAMSNHPSSTATTFGHGSTNTAGTSNPFGSTVSSSSSSTSTSNPFAAATTTATTTVAPSSSNHMFGIPPSTPAPVPVSVPTPSFGFGAPGNTTTSFSAPSFGGNGNGNGGNGNGMTSNPFGVPTNHSLGTNLFGTLPGTNTNNNNNNTATAFGSMVAPTTPFGGMGTGMGVGTGGGGSSLFPGMTPAAPAMTPMSSFGTPGVFAPGPPAAAMTANPFGNMGGGGGGVDMMGGGGFNTGSTQPIAGRKKLKARRP